MSVRCYRDLLVWQKALDLVVESYRLSKLLPRSETYGLVTQMQRAAVSIPANIAEGHGPEHLGDYIHHLSIATGSLMELETHLLIAIRLGFLKDDDVQNVLGLSAEISRMLSGLIKSLKLRHLTPGT